MDDQTLKRKMQLTVSDIPQQGMQCQQDALLIFILEGTMQLLVEDRELTLNHNDLFIINSNYNYSYTGSDNCLYMTVPILYYLTGTLCNGISSSFHCDSTTLDNYAVMELRKLVTRLLFISDYIEENAKSYEYISVYYQLIQFLTDNFIIRTHNTYETPYDSKDEQRRIDIDSYIRINYARNITLEDLSKRLFLSKNYLSRYFNKIYGMSFSKYLMQVRLNNTIDELIYSDKSVTKIAYDNGFESISLFNRCFKEQYGKTPSQFRKSIPQKKQMAKDPQNGKTKEIIERLYAYQNQTQEDYLAVPPQENQIDVENIENTKAIWSRLINIGGASDLLNGGIQEHVLILRQAFHFEYCRIWNIFSEDLSIYNDGSYNFTKLDRIFDFILSTGLKPFIDLEQKPERINKNIHEALLLKNQSVVFGDRDIWIKIFTAFITHIEKRYGIDEVSTWILEVGQCRFYESALNDELYFLEVFNEVYGIVKRHIPKMKVGGICETEYFRLGSRHHFLILWKQQLYQPDFISCMDFEYDVKAMTSIYYRRSLDQHHLLHYIEKIRADMDSAGLNEVDIYVVEWNLTISDRNSINDTCFKGAHIVKSYIDAYDKAEMIGYFLGSDRNCEYFDSNALVHGGRGLLTIDGILKPAAFAFEFLNELLPYCIGRGTHFLVTSNQQNQYKIICHNIKNLNYNYYMTEEEDIDSKNISKYFDNTDNSLLNFNLNGVKNGRYQIKVSRVNPVSGSLLNIWKELGYITEFSRKDIKYLRNVCEPRLSIQFREVEDEHLPISIDMMFNEIALITVEQL